MKEIEVQCIWHSYHLFEVEDNWEDNGSLSDYSEEQLDEMTPQSAELVDWYIAG